MPWYKYKCKYCHSDLIVLHEMDDRQTDCDKCGTKNCLIKVFNVSNIINKSEKKVGSVVEKFIEKTRRELEEAKKELKQKVAGQSKEK